MGWQHVQRYQADASADGQFAGTSKGWSNTEASVPARAVLASKTANPLVFIDEIDKAASSQTHGSLFNSLLSFLEQETAKNYRDQSTDCEFDFSAVSFICTANDVSVLPSHLRDRFRVVKVPAPRLVEPAVAGGFDHRRHAARGRMGRVRRSVRAGRAERHGEGLAGARHVDARALQKIVRATLEARDTNAMRH